MEVTKNFANCYHLAPNGHQICPLKWLVGKEPGIKKGNILALDLGTNLGWAVIDKNGVKASGKEDLAPSRVEGGGMRWVRLHEHLNSINAKYPVSLVSIEDVQGGHTGLWAAHMYGGFQHHVTYWCEINVIPYTGFGVGQIKKHITGSGSASKEAVIRAVQSKGHKTVDDNEADAIALAYLTLEKWSNGVC
jgi:Holliday junction resolvasome RuvABC endonuclease subunit